MVQKFFTYFLDELTCVGYQWKKCDGLIKILDYTPYTF